MRKIVMQLECMNKSSGTVLEYFVGDFQICRFNKRTGELDLSISREHCERFLADYALPMSIILPLPPKHTKPFESVNSFGVIRDGNGRFYFGYENYGFYVTGIEK